MHATILTILIIYTLLWLCK